MTVSAGVTLNTTATNVMKLNQTSATNDLLSVGGSSYREIGEALGISPHTVRVHLHSTYRKLHVQSRAQAVHKVHRRF